MTDRKPAQPRGSCDDPIARAMFDASPDCIKIIGLDGRLKHMNRAGCVALGVNRHKVHGIDWIGLLPSQVHHAGFTSLRGAALGESIRFFGLSDGEGAGFRRWENMLTPIRSEGGAVEDILCISRELTGMTAPDQGPIPDDLAYPPNSKSMVCELDRLAGNGAVGIEINPDLLRFRERECLFWASLGKTAWETSVILGISRRTIEFHLANAIRKLGAANKHHATMIALSNGML